MNVRVRFAPSPTGHVHIGNMRAAIFNWLFARHENGRFLLRIEDTDLERSTPEAVATVLDAMNWLGLDYDEEPLYQSGRKTAHLEAAERLLSAGKAFREDKGGTGRGECVIFRMGAEDVSFDDRIKGALSKSGPDLRDFVIVRSDGTPTFHLANVVDDIFMDVTHIIRGDDHVENTFRHIRLFEALGAEPPVYAHLPMIVNANGKPYSKRDGAAFVGEFRERGFLPDALVNYLALLGWSPGDDREKMGRGELVGAFTLDRVKSSPAQMDILKLTNLNARYVAEMPIGDFAGRVREVLHSCAWAEESDGAYFGRVAELMQSRTHLFSYASGWRYFFSDRFDCDEKALRKAFKDENTLETLGLLAAGLQSADFNVGDIESAIHRIEDSRGIKRGKLNFPIRVAVTGSATGAGIYETMVLLGRERVVERLKHAARGRMPGGDE